jgi:xylitol oxidase
VNGSGIPARNWAGNITFSAADRQAPGSLQELQQLVAGAERVRAVGTAHSFSRIADTPGTLVSVAGLPHSIQLDTDHRRVEVAPGVRYGELGRALEERGFALPNLGSLPHISVAGACSTGTHGSGRNNQALAASVRSLTLVTATGDLWTCERGDPAFDGAVVALGRLGIVATMVLDVLPSFDIAQTVVEHVGQDTVADELVAILSSAYSVSVFTGWDETQGSQVWVKDRVGDPDGWRASELWGGRLAQAPLNPVPGMPPESSTAQLGEPGPWIDRLPHFRYEFTPSNGDELQSEYFVAVDDAAAAWRSLTEISDLLRPALQISEVRIVAADPMWLSLTAGSPTVSFHFTWVADHAVVAPRIAAVEERLDRYGARPHWGKLFATPPDRLAERYPRLGDFRRLVTDLDPSGKFGNDLVDCWIGLAPDGIGE